MKPSTIVTISLLVVFAFACGGKNKKEETAPDLGGPSEEAKDSSTDTSSEQPPASKTAELQHVVYFNFDSSDLDDSARTRLNENHEWLKADAKRTLTIEGHTDEAGTPGYNLALGERRARATQDYLVRLGVEAGRIRIITYGEEKPASKQDSENRRSVFIATKK